MVSCTTPTAPALRSFLTPFATVNASSDATDHVQPAIGLTHFVGINAQLRNRNLGIVIGADKQCGGRVYLFNREGTWHLSLRVWDSALRSLPALLFGPVSPLTVEQLQTGTFQVAIARHVGGITKCLTKRERSSGGLVVQCWDLNPGFPAYAVGRPGPLDDTAHIVRLKASGRVLPRPEAAGATQHPS